MTELIHFTDTTPRHALPFLFAGQAQKEFFINETLARLDLLLHPVIEGEASVPPSAPQAGHCFLITAPASVEWAGREDQIAGWIGGGWVYVAPFEGMHLRDKSNATTLTYNGNWSRPIPPTELSGGNTIDAEARTAISEIVAVFRQIGLLS